MKQTALNWLIEKIHQANPSFKFDALIRQAKAMEKEQIIDTYIHVASEHCDFTLHSETKKLYDKLAKEYYNKTYNP